MLFEYVSHINLKEEKEKRERDRENYLLRLENQRI